MEPDRRLRGRLAALSLAMLLSSLGTSIANVALPDLAASFSASFHEVQWVVIAYLLAITSLIVAAGRLGDRLGRRRLLLVGVAVFAVASAVGGVAPDLWVLVAARGVQGAGAAVMMALAVASVGDMVPKDRTGSAMGLLGAVSAVGTALGPSLGGALVSLFGWQAVFAFMSLSGLATFFVALRMLPATPPAGRRPSLDVAGMVLLSFAIAAYALSTTLDAAHRSTLVILAVTAGVGLLAFVVVERQAKSPLVEVRLLRDRLLASGLAATALVSAIVMTTLVVGPFYLSAGAGLGPAGMGLVMTVGPGVAALVGVPAGRLVDRLGPPAVTMTGLVGVALGSVLMTILPAAFGVGGYVASLASITAGYALFQAANNTAVMNAAEGERRGVTSALLALARNLGLITGASAMGALFAIGSSGAASVGPMAGMRLTFSVAAALAGLALAVAWWGLRGQGRAGRSSPLPRRTPV